MAHEVVEMYGPLSVTVEKLGAKIRDLSVTDRGSWSVVIEGGDIPSTKIELGRNTRDSRVQDRLELVAAHYQEVSRMMGGPPGSIDARYVNAFAATLPRERPKTDAQPSAPGQDPPARIAQERHERGRLYKRICYGQQQFTGST